MNPLSPYLFWIKLGLFALLVAGACYGTWYATSDHYEKIIAQSDAARNKAELAMALNYAQLTQDAEAQHAQDQHAINNLTFQLGSVHVHFPTCGDTPSPSQGANVSTGVLSDSVDAAFADFQAAAGHLIQQADQQNIDTIQQNGELGNDPGP